MKVLRLESKTGDGVYESSLWAWCMGNCESSKRHPMAREDELMNDNCLEFVERNSDYFNKRYFCEDMNFNTMVDKCNYDSTNLPWRYGFLDTKQYLRWVHSRNWRNKLTENEAVLRVYEVDEKHVCQGHTQIIFMYDKSVCIEEYKPNEYRFFKGI